ncbi:MAG TPA: archaellin/type IV pilin N-terminal domain-containing protein [Dehalococcoidales bacterium]|nr:archaellin/type IV pilin N-terminal domain-containing protein [Dehalococcoidales bacterium]
MLRKLFRQKRYFKDIYKSQNGITGLETAIILIAFVVVAAVFAYTVLSAGLFSTQKSQEAVYSGLERTQSTMELKSSVIAVGNMAGANGLVTHLILTVAIASGGNALDFTAPSGHVNGIATGNNSITISLIDKAQRIDNLYWTRTALGQDNGNNLLEQNEQFQITIGDLTQALGNPLTSNSSFTIEIKTAKGAVLSFQRTMPGFVNLNNDLH